MAGSALFEIGCRWLVAHNCASDRMSDNEDHEVHKRGLRFPQLESLGERGLDTIRPLADSPFRDGPFDLGIQRLGQLQIC